MKELYQQYCQSHTTPVHADDLSALLSRIESWQLSNNSKAISKSFRFDNYHQTTTFVNAVAYIAQQQDHHPDVSFGYNHCDIAFSTHSIDGLSMNDFICAARIEHLST